ncbi:hypothetical protein [Mechercharimyces sp. CAU 1602]|uniref:hypothetical protein n=1 Tax=Mechercharimyces sp. CAU 1602 TaxID=2973933 RepID=UPI00216139E5|nr:hypothetical protein [Mechercharimyces sp. CAU 1602]MCS1351198.1 hypothetical protein [Mechercharimyces sp. CAU 1602]
MPRIGAEVERIENGANESDGFTFMVRRQFTFLADDQTYSCILDALVGVGVNVTAVITRKLPSGLNLNLIVVGPPGENVLQQNILMRGVLRFFGIQSRENNVLQVSDFPPGMPGILSPIFGGLWCEMRVSTIYLGEDNRLYLDVSDIPKAIRILSQTPIKQCPKSCTR